MESYLYDEFPDNVCTVHIALFVDVANAAPLRARLVRASTLEGVEGDAEREAVNFAFIDAKLVTSRLHVQTALYQSIIAFTQSALKTKTVHSEVLWSLNPTNNITEALRRFGISDSSTAIVVARVGPQSDRSVIEEQMREVIQGRLVPLDLHNLTDWSAIKKYYKLNTDPVIVAQGQNLNRQRTTIDELVTSFVAMKSVMS
ncbi:CGI-121-domain-containing protein [Rickenella mellea]|uniref:EKC/KEOPS complex subunit CGI121 n=1 Tax=Rickenella mellea TaxID=50990 RepID=A0A4Y7PJD4_9AGAM|nr:CGI-121-domain-containing protein [Rickenella mellea]